MATEQASEKSLAGVRAMAARNAERRAAGLPVGRPRGTPNKLSSVGRAALLQAFENMGGAEFLERWARKHPAQFFALFFKSIPREREANALGTGVQIIVTNYADRTAPAVIDVTPSDET